MNIQCVLQRSNYTFLRLIINFHLQVEKSELQARIALLQGERKGQENLKNDLIRRIKMLEYCLRQERAKFHKLKFGVDPPSYGNSPDDLNDEFNSLELDENMNADGQNSVNWKMVFTTTILIQNLESFSHCFLFLGSSIVASLFTRNRVHRYDNRCTF